MHRIAYFLAMMIHFKYLHRITATLVVTIIQSIQQYNKTFNLSHILAINCYCLSFTQKQLSLPLCSGELNYLK